MEETPNLWNKTTDQVTVKEQLMLAAAGAIIPIVVVAGVGAVVAITDKVRSRTKKAKDTTKIETLNEN